jgi:hypothetical protein
VEGRQFDQPFRPLADADSNFENALDSVFVNRPVDWAVCNGLGKME